ncbi:MAG: phosphatidate cytidylyltransferase, partial [Bacteroidota bacterium]
VLFTFLITAVFDSFSQITGQLAGKKRILPEISPGKTWEGTAGGAAVAMASGLLLTSLIGIQNWQTMLVTVGIILFAFVGDAITSLYKRTYHVKDFTNILPGHGGFLDRFDSFIPAGAFIALLHAFSYI